MWEPRDPLLKVLTDFLITQTPILNKNFMVLGGHEPGNPAGSPGSEQARRPAEATGKVDTGGQVKQPGFVGRLPRHGNDPSAGSPTETLLRLLLPLNDQV